jgi:acyl carrier protein
MSLTSDGEVTRMTFQEARKKVLQALRVATSFVNEPRLSAKLNDPDVDFTFGELQLDSFAAIECCMALEDDIGMDFDPADLTIHNSINKLAENIVQRKTAALRDPS